MLNGPIRLVDLLERMPLVALLPARRALSRFAKRFRLRLLFSQCDEGGLLDLRLFCADNPPQFADQSSFSATLNRSRSGSASMPNHEHKASHGLE